MHNKRKEKGKKKKNKPKAWKYQKISTTVLPGLREQAELSFLIGANYSPFSAALQTVCFKGKVCGALSAWFSEAAVRRLHNNIAANLCAHVHLIVCTYF